MKRLLLIVCLMLAFAATDVHAQFAQAQRIVYLAALPVACNPAVSPMVKLTVAPFTLNACTATDIFTPVNGESLTTLDSRFVNVSGDTMGGLLQIQANDLDHGTMLLNNLTNNVDTAGTIPVFTLYRTPKANVSFPSLATFTLGRFSQVGTGSNSQLDVRLGAGSTGVANTTALTLRADGAHTIFGTLNTTGTIATTTAGTGLTLKSPDGLTCKSVTIDNTGALVLTTVTCP